MLQKTRRGWLTTLFLVGLSTAILYSPLPKQIFEGVSWQGLLQFTPQQSIEEQSSPVQEVAPTPTPPPLPQGNDNEIAPGEEPETIPITRDNLWSDLVWPLLQVLLVFALMAFVPLVTFVVPVVAGFFVIRHLIRKHRPMCETCQVPMKTLIQEKAKPYLDAGQIAEVEVNSICHTVLICPQCNHRKVGHFVAANKLAVECPSCHYKTLAVTDRQNLVKPTYRSTGEAMVQRICRHCGYATAKIEILGKRQRNMSEQESSFVDESWTFKNYFSGFKDENSQ
jgi:hypothetical protein